MTTVANFLPANGPWPGAISISAPLQMNLNGLGFRGIKWRPQIGPNAVGRYLIIGGPAGGGPLAKEQSNQKFQLFSWDGVDGNAPTVVISDLRSYSVRPEALDLISVNGSWRVLFVEDRYRATVPAVLDNFLEGSRGTFVPAPRILKGFDLRGGLLAAFLGEQDVV